jgi:hypothetical protein
MTASVDKRGIYHNRSDDSDWNRGNNGKLSGDQLTERAELHAKRLCFGKPTIQEISEHWNTKYGITMHYNSEKEWAWRNEEAIEAALNGMIESGEVKDPGVNETTFITTVNKTGRETAKVITQIEKNLTAVLKSVELSGDYMAMAGIDPLAYDVANDKERAAFDAKMKRERAKNEFRLEVAVQYSKMLKDHKAVLIETVLAAKDLYQDSKLKQMKNDKQIEKKVSQLIGKHSESGSSNGDEMEITDEMRARILGVNKE